MSKQLTTNLSTVLNKPLSDIIHGLFNYGIDGDIISGGMLVNSAPNVFEESEDQIATIGSKLRQRNGSEFIYSKNGNAEIGIALMAQAEAATGTWNSTLQTGWGWSSEAGSGVIVIASGAPSVNEWAEGCLLVTKGTGLGQMYRIQTNTSHATLPLVTIYGEIVTAFPATSEVTILKSNFMDTIVVPTGGLTAMAVGVPLITVTANYYYWGQIKGPCPMILDTAESVSIGMPVTHPATSAVAGAIGPCVTLENRYGYVMFASEVAEPTIVQLDLGL